jgi:hypothetical protein
MKKYYNKEIDILTDLYVFNLPDYKTLVSGVLSVIYVCISVRLGGT